MILAGGCAGGASLAEVGQTGFDGGECGEQASCLLWLSPV